MSISEVDYELKVSFKYAHPDGESDANLIRMYPPKLKNIKHIAPLKQAFMQAVVEVSRQSNSTSDSSSVDSDKEDTRTGSDVIAAIEASNVDMGKMLEQFQTLILRSDLFKIDGEVKITDVLLSRISIEDFYEMLGEYMINFIVASLIK